LNATKLPLTERLLHQKRNFHFYKVHIILFFMRYINGIFLGVFLCDLANYPAMLKNYVVPLGKIYAAIKPMSPLTASV